MAYAKNPSYQNNWDSFLDIEYDLFNLYYYFKYLTTNKHADNNKKGR